MSDERKLIPADPEYLSALGLTTYAFARCEWQIVWCSERIHPGSVTKIVSEEMTAGTIGKLSWSSFFGQIDKEKSGSVGLRESCSMKLFKLVGGNITQS